MLRSLWNNLSRNGLYTDEDVATHREVILLNRTLVVSIIVMFFVIPLEIAINGFELVPLEILLIVLMLIAFYLQRVRKFSAAKFYVVTAGNSFILGAGTLVGRGVDNQIAFIPIMLFGLVLFKSKTHKIINFILSICFYTAMLYLTSHISPVVNVPLENKEKFRYVFYFLSLLLTFLLAWYFSGINNEYEDIIKKQSESLSEKNREITDSITYAKRIQQARLPALNDLSSAIPESFILFLPKDIVSGDFYFFIHDNDFTWLAIADCTGHGVPGSLMSMIGSEKLELALHREQEPGKVLSALNLLMKSALHQDDSDASTRDGMDIALIRFNRKNGELLYAGANRPLWLLRRNSKEIEEVKATKKAIGGLTPDDAIFNTVKIQLYNQDLVYLFTDGYADQFSGHDGKKMMGKRFKQTLLQYRHNPMPEQSDMIRRNFESWRQKAEQVDDVLVCGLQFLTA